MQLKGFRKGKVPVAHIKKLYGRSVMAEVLQQAVEETSRKAHRGAQGARRAPAQYQPHRGQGRDRARADGTERPRLHACPTRRCPTSPHRPCRAHARAPGGRGHRGGDRQGRGRVWPSGRSATRWRRTGRRATATGSPSTSSAASTARSSRAARARTCSWWSGNRASSRASSRASRAPRPARSAPSMSKFPDDYPRADAGRQGCGLHRQGEGGGQGRSSPRSNDEFAKTLGAESVANLRELVAGRIASEYAVGLAHEAQAPDPRRARQGARLRPAGDAGGKRVRRHLEAADAEPRASQEDLRRRGQDRGGA